MMMNTVRRMTLRGWLAGCIGAAINSGIGGITLVIVKPEDFNPFGTGSWVDLGKVCVALALVGFALYVKEHPIPLIDEHEEV